MEILISSGLEDGLGALDNNNDGKEECLKHSITYKLQTCYSVSMNGKSENS